MQTTAHPLPHRSVGSLLLLGCTALSLFTACGGPPGAVGPETQASGGVRAREIPKVRVVEIERREMRQVLETMTKLESELEIQLYPQVAGTVESVLVEEGDHVRRDDVLATLDDRDQVLAVRDATVALEEARNSAELAKLAVDEAKARMDSAELTSKQAVRDYERNLKLFEGREATSSLSKSALEASELERDRADHDFRLATLSWQKSQLDAKASTTAVERAKVALDRAEVTLSHYQLTAPFDGIIAERLIRVGDSAGAGAPAYVLTDPKNLRAVFRRPQEELPMFQSSTNGKTDAVLDVTATAEALPGETFRGEVERVSPTINPDSGQFRVTARLHAADEGDGTPHLLPGMLVRLDIVTDRHPEALVVPKRALRREGERRYVYVVESPDAAPPEAAVPDPPDSPTSKADPTGDEATPGDELAEHTPPAVESRRKSVRQIRRVDIEEGYDDDDFVEIAALDGPPLTESTIIVLVGSRDLEDGDLVDIGGDTEPETSPTAPTVDGADKLVDVASDGETADGER